MTALAKTLMEIGHRDCKGGFAFFLAGWFDESAKITVRKRRKRTGLKQAAGLYLDILKGRDA